MTFSKSATPQRILAEGEKSATLRRKFVLSWNHYQILSHVDNPEARSFYEIEAFEQHWSTRYLQRQIGSGLYERLALSRDKDDVIRVFHYDKPRAADKKIERLKADNHIVRIAEGDDFGKFRKLQTMTA